MDTDQLSTVISHATAPSFLLGAVSGFVAVLIGRMNGIIDRIRYLNAIADGDAARAHLRSDLPRLKRRAKLMNDAIFFAVASALCTTLLVILAFASALVGRRHEPFAAVMFYHRSWAPGRFTVQPRAGGQDSAQRVRPLCVIGGSSPMAGCPRVKTT